MTYKRIIQCHGSNTTIKSKEKASDTSIHSPSVHHHYHHHHQANFPSTWGQLWIADSVSW